MLNSKTILWIILGISLLNISPAFSQTTEVPKTFEGRGEREMVLIHGLGSSAEVWKEMTPYLTAVFKVEAFELGGHGKTQPLAVPTIAAEVARLRAFIQEKGFAYPTLVGHGLGGMIALQYATEHPADVHRLIMLDAGPVQLASPEQKKEVAAELLNNYDRFIGGRYSMMSPYENITDEILDSALKTDRASFTSLLMDSFEFDMTEKLHTLTVPLLVMGSELLFPNPDQCQAVLNQIGFGKARALSFKRMGQTGHFMMLERPAYTSSVIGTFGMDAAHIFEN